MTAPDTATLIAGLAAIYPGWEFGHRAQAASSGPDRVVWFARRDGETLTAWSPEGLAEQLDEWEGAGECPS